MIVDGKGDLFEDRRKAHNDRRKNTEDATGGRRKGDRKEDRRKESNKQRKK